MLRGRSPWGLGGVVYLLVRSFARSRVRRCEVVDAFNWGLGVEGRWIPSRIREDYTGLNRGVAVVYYKGGYRQ